MKQPTLQQIVDTINHAYDIDVHQYTTELTSALAECKRAEVNLDIIHKHVCCIKSTLSTVNFNIANEYAKLDKAQTEKEINEIMSDLRWYALDRANTKQSLKSYRKTAQSIYTNGHEAYKQLLKYYKDALNIIEKTEADAAAEARKAAEAKAESEAAANLYTLTRKEAVELLSHITKALTSNKDEQQFLLDMSHYKK